MQDSIGREINYLRISVTDRCNLRCRYCMPPEGINDKGHSRILSLEEITRVVNLVAPLGICKVRITGGEPLVRKNITQLVSYINDIPQIDDIAMTTNGILFADMADDLRAAGLDRVNFSLDTLVPEKYKYITRGGSLAAVKEAIHKALELGMKPVKLNTVVIRGFNDEELLDFAQLAIKYPLHIRFIEFMPVGDLLFWSPQRMISSEETKNIIESQYNLVERKRLLTGCGPAKYYALQGGKGSLGFISPLSNHFCGECNRIRLTADGKLRGCLHSKEEVDLKGAMERGASDEELQQLFVQAVKYKPRRHQMNAGWGEDNQRKMYQIGG